jgi:hypothetical protein
VTSAAAIEAEANRAALAAAAREESVRLRAVEAEMGLGLFRLCPGCGRQVRPADWPHHLNARPDLCDREAKGLAA